MPGCADFEFGKGGRRDFCKSAFVDFGECLMSVNLCDFYNLPEQSLISFCVLSFCVDSNNQLGEDIGNSRGSCRENGGGKQKSFDELMDEMERQKRRKNMNQTPR